ncbi:GDSL esterase/lipase At1g09390 isoform X1 [Aegilops tauschii subsp. strangulata]|uniref:GDSL esterase/lipase LIP-4 n=3 Tax=Aegilops tauschii subsp. strangulata TaxID=200361 RepID=A0A452XRE9_AEGTS|nr:GDSL esterase/lipase At1g09390 isoform X1 [Aegilops tauschii subsp. strangulata]
MSAAGCSALWLAFVLLLALALALALALSPPLAKAGGFSCSPGARPVVFNFGDSNSDTGGIAAAKGRHIALPEGRAFFHHPTGRFCDGRLIIDFLCESLNISYLSPYLKVLGSNYSNGVNFAIGGSKTLPRDVLFALHVQVQEFLFFKDRSLELINQGQETPIDAEGFQNALYTIDIGQNDINALLSNLPYDQVVAKFPPILAEIKYAVQILYDNGSRNFWIHGTGALGCLPQKLSIPRKNYSYLDQNGCLKTYNRAAVAFNAALGSLCDQLNVELKNATVVYTDLFAIKYDLVASHTKYGFDRPLMTCCGYGGPPYNYDLRRSCQSPNATVCTDGSKFVSWDGVHLTEAANAVAAAAILSSAYSRPKLKFYQFCKA